ncbi:MAG: hypothetical protein RIB61_03325 [Roseicyclus sp.]
MARDEKRHDRPKSAAAIRDERLKAALKANLARRKAQARARAEDDKTSPPDQSGEA